MRVLLVRFSAIGDCVMAAHAATALRRSHPQATIAWAADPRCSDVIDREKLVSEVYDIPRDRWKKERVSSIAQLRYYAQLRRYRFDYGFDLQGHSKTAICLRLAGAKRVASMEALDPAARIIGRRVRVRSTHMVERMTETIASEIELSQGGKPPIMPTLVEERAKVGSGFVSIHIGAGATWKKWPLDRWEKVGAEILSRGHQVTFLGGPGDGNPVCGGATNWSGKLTLRESIAAVAQSRVHLAADTGSGHMAAAYGVPVVSVFGRTEPALYRPYTSKGIVLRNGKATENVSVEEVLIAFEEALKFALPQR